MIPDPLILAWGVPVVAALIGAVIARLVSVFSLRGADESVMRTNVDGRPVPVVLGWPLVAGGLAALVFVAFWSHQLSASGSANFGYRFFFHHHDGLEWIQRAHEGLLWVSHWLTGSAIVLISVMYRAGLWDDLRGDERPRGFRGHLAALRGGRLTGGLVKVIAGGVVGVLVTWMILGTFRPLLLFALIALAMPLGANLLNLFDRAPGRASKVFLLLAIPLAAFGDPLWRTLAAGSIGATLALLPFDLKARGMLGDAGVNPLGGILGLGLAVNFAGSMWSLAGVVLLLLALNVASEKWSFSEIIANNRLLARLDHLGRE